MHCLTASRPGHNLLVLPAALIQKPEFSVLLEGRTADLESVAFIDRSVMLTRLELTDTINLLNNLVNQCHLQKYDPDVIGTRNLLIWS